MYQNQKIAIITSRFNGPVTEKLYQGAIDRLTEINFPDANIKSVWVPGAFELPLAAQVLAQTNQFDDIITLGAVIRGETTHYDYVCEQASQGCLQVSLKFNIPVIFGVLTTENAEQAYARCGGDKGNKGAESVDCAIEMIEILVKSS